MPIGREQTHKHGAYVKVKYEQRKVIFIAHFWR